MSLPILQKLAEKADDYLAFESEEVITWCSNCGNYGIQNALKRALALEGLTHRDVVLCFDVGCSGNGSDKIHANTIHGLHGRVISLAAGVKAANHNLKVIASAGDGATFSEGVNHLVHGVRNDYPIMFIHHNNENYGLTTGQASATTPEKWKMNGAPKGVSTPPIAVLDFVLSLNPSFVARSFSSDVDQMTSIFQEALHHRGFAFIEILQTCPTYNRESPDHWYTERLHDIAKLPDYDNTDIWAARRLVSLDMEEKFHTGIIYKNTNRTDFISALPNRSWEDTALIHEVKPMDISEFIN